MIAAAYYYAVGEGHKPLELRLYDAIQSYGIRAVLGRPLWARELRRMDTARAVYMVKLKSLDKENWAKWAEANPREAELLVSVEKLIEELENAW